MRFHKFKRPVSRDEMWINLDAITVLGRAADGRTSINIGSWGRYVDMPLEDVLALISPPAAPDTYEEELAVKAYIDRMRAKVVEAPIQFDYLDNEGAMRTAKVASEAMQDTADLQLPDFPPQMLMEAAARQARLDELERLRTTVNRAFHGLLDGAGLERQFNAIIEARRAVLEA